MKRRLMHMDCKNFKKSTEKKQKLKSRMTYSVHQHTQPFWQSCPAREEFTTSQIRLDQDKDKDFKTRSIQGAAIHSFSSQPIVFNVCYEAYPQTPPIDIFSSFFFETIFTIAYVSFLNVWHLFCISKKCHVITGQVKLSKHQNWHVSTDTPPPPLMTSHSGKCPSLCALEKFQVFPRPGS